MRLIKAFLISLGLLASPLAAQDAGNTILVLDASGSMWGQIDGVAKITIAQEVVTDLLATLPADQNLGLTVYGHRTRGDCTDIETVVPPGPNTRDAIAAAVAGIKPLGKTPMTDAIIAAAEALRYTEEKATVILVSDGVETCNPDPCAAARLLEEAGIDFTAHVVGFDVGNDPEALAQMQCLADETGGKFLTAANASELASALQEVAAEPEPPALAQITFMAVEEGQVVAMNEPVLWNVVAEDGSTYITDKTAPGFTQDVPVGNYTITAIRLSTEDVATADLRVAPAPGTVAVIFPVPTPQATLDAPETAPIGSEVAVTWTGPNESLDNIQVGTADDGYVYAYSYTDTGNPVTVTMPSTPGTYELRYRFHDDTTIATRVIEVVPAEVSLTAVDTAPGGSTVDVTWVGPNSSLDNIRITGPDGEKTYDYGYTDNANPVPLILPWAPGTYQFQYMFQDKEVIATRTIEVTPGEVSLDAPDTGPLGSQISVGWTGPDANLDNIRIGMVGDEGYKDYQYTSNGTPLTLTLPSEPGDYELRYMFRDSEVIATRPITVTEVANELIAPDTAVGGATVQVGWEGPGGPQDFLGVGKVGDDAYINYTYIRDDNPAELQMPIDPGEYEIRYYLAGDNAILTRRPITITPLKVTFTAPGEAVGGATVEVAYDGPDYPQDFIGVGLPGDDAYINYTYARGTPAEVQMPIDPGTYEIRYYLGQDNTIAQRTEITITPLKVQLVASATAALADGKIIVGFDAPGYPQDFIGIGPVGDDAYTTYSYVRQENPIEIELPEAAGDYEIRYYLGQDNTIVARLPLTVTK